MSETTNIKELCETYLGKKKKPDTKIFETASIIDLISTRFQEFGISEEEIERELRKRVVLIEDMNTLIKLRDTVFLREFARRVIEERIVVFLDSVSKDYLPKWFLEMLEDPENVPDFLQVQFLYKVQKIHDSVSPRKK